MLKGKKSLVLFAIIVSSLVAVPTAQATHLFPDGGLALIRRRK